MGNLFESLEGRTLFSAAVPAAVAAAYATVRQDNVTLKADVSAERTAFHGQLAVLTADVKAAGHTKANVALLAKVKATGAATVNAIARETGSYTAAVSAATKRYEAASAAYAAKPTTAAGKHLTAAQAAVQAVEGKQMAVLTAEVANGGGPLGDALTALGTANATGTSAADQQLVADVQAAGADQETLAQTQYAHLTTATTDLGTLLAAD